MYHVAAPMARDSVRGKASPTFALLFPFSEAFLVITLPKKGNLQQCQNYRKVSLISHPSKVMLKVILNRLKPQAVKIIAEEQAGFRAGRNTTKQIFNLRILCVCLGLGVSKQESSNG